MGGRSSINTFIYAEQKNFSHHSIGIIGELANLADNQTQIGQDFSLLSSNTPVAKLDIEHAIRHIMSYREYSSNLGFHLTHYQRLVIRVLDRIKSQTGLRLLQFRCEAESIFREDISDIRAASNQGKDLKGRKYFLSFKINQKTCRKIFVTSIACK